MDRRGSPAAGDGGVRHDGVGSPGSSEDSAHGGGMRPVHGRGLRRGWTMPMTRRSLAASLLGLVGAGCNLGTRTIRYRLRLDVATPEDLKSGFSVIQEDVRWNDGVLRGLGAGPGIARKRRGEAVIVDLGSRGLLFCLLTKDGSRPDSTGEDLLRTAFPFREWSAPGWLNSGDDSYLAFLDNLNARRPTGNVPLARLPMLVRFRISTDPKTAERIEPQNLVSAFGAGFSIERSTVEITSDPVTNGIEKYLPWITNPSVLTPPGWTELPYIPRISINGLFTGTPEEHFR